MFETIVDIWTWISSGLPLITLFFFSIGFWSLFTYLARVIPLAFIHKPRDLKQLYGAEWAVVTGASGGIGKSICHKLASQGINVVLAALDDQYLATAMTELTQKYPKVSFKPVGVNLGEGDYVTPLIEATKDIKVSIVFNNAGYITTGLFSDLELTPQLRNLECNATSAVKITHHFVNRMLDEKIKGLIAFTSSSAAFMPSPMASIYGSSKAFLTEFATSIACELKDGNIDVVVVHPSPINSRFYDNAGSLDMLRFFQRTAVSPDTITDYLFAAAGRAVVVDQGYFSIGVKLMLKALDLNCMSDFIPYTFPYQPAFQSLKKPRPFAKTTKKE